MGQGLNIVLDNAITLLKFNQIHKGLVIGTY